MLRLQPSCATRGDFELPAGEVHLWAFERALSAKRQHALESVLDEPERIRAGRFAGREQQIGFIAGHGWLRLLLAAYTGVAPRRLEFVQGAHGKPRLHCNGVSPAPVFNLSHSGDKLIFAVAAAGILGVDIERIRPLVNLDGMARRCLGEAELEAWSGWPESERTAAFFRYWTLKESCLKASGRGISGGMQQCVFSPQDPPRVLSLAECCGDPCRWSLYRFDCGHGYCGALAAGFEVRRIEYRELPAGRLVDLYL